MLNEYERFMEHLYTLFFIYASSVFWTKCLSLIVHRCVFVCFLDQHKGVCFASVVNGRCAQEIRGRFSKIQCCCDRGRCWSQRTALQMCPVPGSGD